MKKSELLNWLQEEYQQWEALLEQIDLTRMEQPGVNGDWSMKDMVAHLTGWNCWHVARFDSKLDHTTNTFVILGSWLEDETLGKDEAFAEALACGFARFVTFLGASKLDAKAIGESLLRRRAGSPKEAN